MPINRSKCSKGTTAQARGSWHIHGGTADCSPDEPAPARTSSNSTTLPARSSVATSSGEHASAGTVTSGDGRIACPADCSEIYANGADRNRGHRTDEAGCGRDGDKAGDGADPGLRLRSAVR